MEQMQYGRYHLKHQLGQGGMGDVFLAHDPHFERDVALKLLPRGLMREPGFRERFLKEAKLIARVEHAAIVPVYDFGEDHGQPFIVMRLMDGGSLADKLGDGPLPLNEAAVTMNRICGALDKAHANQIIHRDIKPANILFDSDGAAYLADFGIARLAEGTQTMTIIGTPRYMAPEQAHGKALDARTDIYQMGVVLYEMLTGEVPFKANTPAALLHQHAYEPAPSPLTANGKLPPAVETVIERALAKEQEERYARASDLAAAFQLVMLDRQSAVRAEAETRRARQGAAEQYAAELPAFDTDGRAKGATAVPGRGGRPPVDRTVPGAGLEQQTARRAERPRWIWGIGAVLLVGVVLLGIALLGGGISLINDPAESAPVAGAAAATEMVPAQLPEDEDPAAAAVADEAEPTAVPSPTPPPTATTMARSPVDALSAVVALLPDTEEARTLYILTDFIEAALWEEIAADVADQYGITLVVDISDNVREDFIRSAGAGNGPDIVIGAHDWLGELVQSDLVAPIDLGSKADDFADIAIAGFTGGDRLYGLPYAVENIALFYNTDLVSVPPQTWNQAIEIGAELMDADAAAYALHFVDASYNMYPLFTSFGGYVFGVDEGGEYDPADVGLDSPGMIAAGEFLQLHAETGRISNSTDWVSAHTLFDNGELPFLLTGPWALERLRASGVPYAITEVPEGGQPFIGVRGFMLNAGSDHLNLGRAFLVEYVATAEVMTRLVDAGNRPSAHKAVQAGSDDPDLIALAAAGENGQLMPAIPEMSAVWSAWEQAVEQILLLENAPDAAFGAAAAQIRAAIGQ